MPNHGHNHSSISHTPRPPLHLPPLKNTPPPQNKPSTNVSFSHKNSQKSDHTSSPTAYSSKGSISNLSTRESYSKSAPPRSRESNRSKATNNSSAGSTPKGVLPQELANSPYLPQKDKLNYKLVTIERQKEIFRNKENAYRERKSYEPQRKSIEPSPPPKPKPVADYSYVSTSVDAWRIPRFPKGVTFAELEERARKQAVKAMKASLISLCLI